MINLNVNFKRTGKATALFFIMLSSIYACTPAQQERRMTPNNPHDAYDVAVPTAGNSWIIGQENSTEDMVTDSGIYGWSGKQDTIRSYFHVQEQDSVKLALRIRTQGNPVHIQWSSKNAYGNSKITDTRFDTLQLGTYPIPANGYHHLDISKPKASSSTPLDYTHVLVDGVEEKKQIHYVDKDFYWGRRGPSVHLNYQTPPQADSVLWFYNEVQVPEAYDVPGSFYMANGFAHGYFGMQVNSPKERRILFSVWSPHETDKPEDIPEDKRVELLKKGEDVVAGKFGNEGSGGQSYLKYPWKANRSYQFLLKGQPKDSSTVYTAYFRAPATDGWKLIASFNRPREATYLDHLHSFLENFLPSRGNQTRQGYYSNQWVYDHQGQWHEITKARFSADATARKGDRLDYAGGTNSGCFFLKNCGFFDEKTQRGIHLERTKTGGPPQIDFQALP